MKLTKREKVLLIFALIIAILTFFVVYVYLPLQDKIDILQKESDDLALQIQDAKTKEIQIKSLEIELDEMVKKVDEEYKDILQIWDQPELLNFIEVTMKNYCEKQSIDFFDPIDVSSIRTGEITLKVKTDYENLQRLWKDFEKSKYFNTLQSFAINKNMDDSESNNSQQVKLDVTMVLRFYAKNQTQEYPEKYDFIKGNYGKKDIYK